MAISYDIERILINDAKIIIDAYTKLTDIDEGFGYFITKFMMNKISEQADWWYDDDNFGPNDWPNKNGRYDVFYKIDYSEEFDNTPWVLCASGEKGRLGISLVIALSRQKKNSYSKKIQNFFDSNKMSKLEGCDLSSLKNKGKIFFPLKVSLEDIAADYPDWDGVVSEIFDKALAKFFEDHKIIDGFIKSL